ncbi:MAG: mechanosensitive ion channel [Saprospiraceae bacterium]|nr:mechanosensitive ion channel [Saprospiraceae bacterium]
MKDFFSQILFSYGDIEIRLSQVVFAVLVLVIMFFIFKKLQLLRLKDYLASKGIEKSQIRVFFRRYIFFGILFTTLLFIRIFNVHLVIININEYELTLKFLLEAFTIISLATVVDWILSYIFIQDYFVKRELRKPALPKGPDKDADKNGTRLVQYIVYLYGLIIIMKKFSIDYIIFKKELKGGVFTLAISDILMAVLILLVARLVVWFLTQISLYSVYKNKNMDEGSQYAINQLVAYVVYTFAIVFAMDQLVSDMKLVYGGAAALLVGVGLGLQQTFNDFFSGLVLLFERTVMVGDVVEMEGRVGRVKKIGLRASLIETRQNVSLLVPNSKLVNQFVVNWTHFNDVVRFQVDVGVAYGSDTRLVEKLLFQSIESNERILKEPKPFVRFNDFGDSALLFSIYFFSVNTMNIDDVKSEVRFEIDHLFRDNGITIPFPQRDVWVKKE